MGIVSRLKGRYDRFQRIRERSGTKQAIKEAIQYFKKRPREALLFKERRYQTNKRVDLEQRWQLIREEIADDHQNLLDLGCNEGELTSRAATSGLLAVGVDFDDRFLESARKKVTDTQDIWFIKMETHPENIHKLPDFDMVLLLTVYYHWGNAYGWEDAHEMLQHVVDSSDVLIFETGIYREKITDDRLEQYDQFEPVEKMERYLNDILDEGSQIEHIGTTDYTGRERKEVIFAIR